MIESLLAEGRVNLRDDRDVRVRHIFDLDQMLISERRVKHVDILIAVEQVLKIGGVNRRKRVEIENRSVRNYLVANLLFNSIPSFLVARSIHAPHNFSLISS